MTLRHKFNTIDNLSSLLDKLISKKLIIRDYTYKTKANKIYITYASLNVTVNDDILATLKNKPAQKKALSYLAKIKEASTKDLTNEKISLPTLKALADLDYIKLEKKQILRDSYHQIITKQNADKKLTSDQMTALKNIEIAQHQGKQKFLLYGVTGSGKTQI